MNDAIIANAEHAANTPASGPPPEARRLAIAKELIGGSLDAPTRAERLAELKRLTSDPAAVAAEDAARAEADAKVPASERRRRELTAELVRGKLTEAERAAKTRELQQVLAAQATDTERDALVNAPVEELRARFGVTSMDDLLVPLREKWSSEGEAQVLATFADHGVDAPVVRAVMDWYVAKWNGALGDPANIGDFNALADEFKAFAKKQGLAPKLTDALINWQKERLEGGGAA